MFLMPLPVCFTGGAPAGLSHSECVINKPKTAQFTGKIKCARNNAERKTKNGRTKKPVRTTVYLDEETLLRCKILFGEAKVDSVSAFIRKALDCYIDYLITDKPHPFISEELIKAIRDEVRPIASRLSKGLYRYAVVLDMLCQIIAYQDTPWSEQELEIARKFANKRIAKSRGAIDIKALLDDCWGIDSGFNEE